MTTARKVIDDAAGLDRKIIDLKTFFRLMKTARKIMDDAADLELKNC